MGEDGHCLPKKDTQAYRLLELVAVCGEFPAEEIYRLIGSKLQRDCHMGFKKRKAFTGVLPG